MLDLFSTGGFITIGERVSGNVVVGFACGALYLLVGDATGANSLGVDSSVSAFRASERFAKRRWAPTDVARWSAGCFLSLRSLPHCATLSTPASKRTPTERRSLTRKCARRWPVAELISAVVTPWFMASLSPRPIPIGNRWSPEALVEGLKSRRSEAAAAFYDRVGSQVNRMVGKLLGPDREHDDVVHQVFVNCLQSIHTLRDPHKLEG
jgi:hypothetical protein